MFYLNGSVDLSPKHIEFGMKLWLIFFVNAKAKHSFKALQTNALFTVCSYSDFYYYITFIDYITFNSFNDKFDFFSQLLIFMLFLNEPNCL